MQSLAKKVNLFCKPNVLKFSQKFFRMGKCKYLNKLVNNKNFRNFTINAKISIQKYWKLIIKEWAVFPILFNSIFGIFFHENNSSKEFTEDENPFLQFDFIITKTSFYISGGIIKIRWRRSKKSEKKSFSKLNQRWRKTTEWFSSFSFFSWTSCNI